MAEFHHSHYFLFKGRLKKRITNFENKLVYLSGGSLVGSITSRCSENEPALLFRAQLTWGNRSLREPDLHLFQTRFVIDRENNRDGDITIPLSRKTIGSAGYRDQ